MSTESEELEQLPPQGHIKVVYMGPVSPHWEVRGVFGDRQVVDELPRAGARPPPAAPAARPAVPPQP